LIRSFLLPIAHKNCITPYTEILCNTVCSTELTMYTRAVCTHHFAGQKARRNFATVSIISVHHGVAWWLEDRASAGDASQLHGVSSSHWLIRVRLRRGTGVAMQSFCVRPSRRNPQKNVWQVLALVGGGIMRMYRFMTRRACRIISCSISGMMSQWLSRVQIWSEHIFFNIE